MSWLAKLGRVVPIAIGLFAGLRQRRLEKREKLAPRVCNSVGSGAEQRFLGIELIHQLVGFGRVSSRLKGGWIGSYPVALLPMALGMRLT